MNENNNFNVIQLAEFAKANNYDFKPENGQLVYGPPLDMLDFVPPKSSEVFIGKLPKDIDGRLIVNKFSEYGRIITFRIMQNFSGLNRGFAFLQYQTIEQADNAIAALNNYEIRPGNRIGVIRSRNNNRLYIGRLDTSLKKEQIMAYFSNLTTGLINITIHKDKDRAKDYGYAFLEYETHKDAARARRSLKPCKLRLGSKSFTVDWATTTGPEYPATLTSEQTRSNSFTSRFNEIVQSHLSPNNENNNQSVENDDVLLICTNIRKDASMSDLIKIFSANSQISLSSIQMTDNYLLIYYSSLKMALAILKTFSEIKKEFSLFFANEDRLCELIWPNDQNDGLNTELNFLGIPTH